MKIRRDLDYVPALADGTKLVIKAEILDIAQHLAMVATFVLHESAEIYGDGLYQVGNLETGHAVGKPNRVRDFVVHRAEAILRKKSAKDIVKAMNAAMKRYRVIDAAMQASAAEGKG